MSSKVQREKAEKKRQTIQNDIIDKMSLFAKENKWDKELKLGDVLSYGDKCIKELIRKNPQDKTLIISASLSLRKHIEDLFKNKIGD